jgi:ubiquinone/menaquinone biosynthesis C-methylase UbiE
MSAKQPDVAFFDCVDQARDPQFLVNWLDAASAMESARKWKQQTFALLDIKEGDQVLDVGCGPGDDVRALSRIVGDTGRVVGVDSSQIMIAEAQQRLEGLDLPVEYDVQSVYDLGFPDGTFDACRSERLFVHLESPQQALAEMARVARSGASILCFEADFETLIIDGPDRPLTRRMLNFLCDSLRNGWAGRQLRALFTVSGLTQITMTPVNLIHTDYTAADNFWLLRQTAESAKESNLISAAEADHWLNHLQQASQSQRFFCAATAFIVAGRKP